MRNCFVCLFSVGLVGLATWMTSTEAQAQVAVPYYAPQVVAPVTTYYAPVVRRPVTTYYAQPATTYYAPSVAAPVTTYYAPAPPVVAAPVVLRRPVVVRTKVYVPWQPVRNVLKAITP